MIRGRRRVSAKEFEMRIVGVVMCTVLLSWTAVSCAAYSTHGLCIEAAEGDEAKIEVCKAERRERERRRAEQRPTQSGTVGGGGTPGPY